MTHGLGNSRIFVIASEAKQSLEILDFVLGILDLFLKILEFPKIRHCEALKKPKQSRSKFRLKFPKPRVIPRLDRGISL